MTTTKTTLLNPALTEHEERIIDLLDSLYRARSYAYLCDEDDGSDAEYNIREAIKLIEADYPSLSPSKLKPDKFSRWMDYSERLSTIRDLISILEGCLDDAEEFGFYATDVTGYIEVAIDAAKESYTLVSELLEEEEADDRYYSIDSYYRAAI